MARGERTPEERERARLERAAKRAAREGRPAPTELPSLEVPPPPVGERAETAPRSPAADQPPVVGEPSAVEEPPARFEADAFLEEKPAPPAEPAGAAAGDADPLPETADLPAVEPEPELFYDPLHDQADAPAPEPPAPPVSPAAAQPAGTGEHPVETGEHPVEREPLDTGERLAESEASEAGGHPVEGGPFETGEHPVERGPFETGEHPVERGPFETGEHPVERGPFETGEHPVEGEPFETGEHPVERGPFEIGEHPVEGEPFETGEHSVEREPFETGEHPAEHELFETGEHLVENEAFETGDHKVGDGLLETGEHPVEDEPFDTDEHLATEPLPDDERPEPRPLAALPAYPPVSPQGTSEPAAAARRDRARRIVDLNQAALAPEPPRKTRSRARYVVLALLAVIVIAIAWLGNSLFQPFKGDGSGRTTVQIPTGASVGQIADLLKSKGVISSSFFFEARATIAGRRDDFKAGRFTLANGMSNSAAMDAISKGPPPDVTQVVIPEGRARAQVRDLIGKRLRGNYLALTRKSSVLNPRRYGAPRSVANLEGFLFPDTYELKKGATTERLVRDQLAQFKREFAKVDLAAAKRRKLTPYDVLIIASMIDQEAQVPRERRLVASVITNRLREGIPLGIDATTRYATNNRTRPLTRSELEIDSPYNTRNRRGLPPGPIGSPGLAAIRAAANPARTSYLFYVVKPCGNGSHAFSRTNAEFERDAQRYNTARARRGGKSPTNC